jgi:hypothetical protein
MMESKAKSSDKVSGTQLSVFLVLEKALLAAVLLYLKPTTKMAT